MVSFSEFVADQRRTLPMLATKENCSGGTYIVSGANSGLGYEVTKHLLLLGAKRVIMAVRNRTAGETAKEEIETATKVHNVAEVWSLDLTSYDSVKAFAKKAIDQLDRIDALLEVAGVALDKWTTAEGHESCITINVLSTLLLAVLLLPKMMGSAKGSRFVPHIVIVTSEVAFFAKAEYDNIKDDPFPKMNDQKKADMTQRYQLSKLIQILATRQLCSLVPVHRTGVIINILNPGMSKTRLSRHARLAMRVQVTVANALFGRTVEMASRTILHAMIAGEDSHGCYLAACEIKENQVPDWAKDQEAKEVQKRVWDDVAKELESIQPGCVKKIV